MTRVRRRARFARYARPGIVKPSLPNRFWLCIGCEVKVRENPGRFRGFVPPFGPQNGEKASQIGGRAHSGLEKPVPSDLRNPQPEPHGHSAFAFHR
jgi:hypothetical protein